VRTGALGMLWGQVMIQKAANRPLLLFHPFPNQCLRLFWRVPEHYTTVSKVIKAEK